MNKTFFRTLISLGALLLIFFSFSDAFANGSFYRPGKLHSAEAEAPMEAMGAETTQCPNCQAACDLGSTGTGCHRDPGLANPLAASGTSSPKGDDSTTH